MAWTYGFHNSVNGDRLYNADQMSGIFEGLITSGVYESVGNKLAVQPNNGMVIQINTGRGWFNNRWVNNDSAYLITLAGSDVILNRYAAICVRGDNTDSVRSTTPYVKYSDFATTPVKPVMERTNTIKEYCLAYVYIGAGVTEITAADIEDARGNSEVCGWVTGLIDQIDSTTLFEQFTGIFNQFYNGAEEAFREWFTGLVDDLNPNTEAMLVNALPTSNTITLSDDGWNKVENIFNLTLTTQTISGVTFTVNSNGTITANGTASADIELQIGSVNTNGIVRLVGCPAGGSESTYNLFVIGAGSDTGNGLNFNGDDRVRYALIRIKSGTAVNSLVFKPMISQYNYDFTYDEYTQVGVSYYVQVITVVNMSGTKCVLVQPNADTVASYTAKGVTAIGQGDSYLTFKAATLPDTDIKVDITHFGV